MNRLDTYYRMTDTHRQLQVVQLNVYTRREGERDREV